jgi:DNA polymerase-3 subunit gamma/tau
MSSLAEKYRPDSKEALLGQPNADLIFDLSDQYIPPSYLFYGPPGTGKTTTAKLLINHIENKHEKDWDIVEYNCGMKGGVDDIKSLIENKCQIPPTVMSKRYVILDECHMLTLQAQNSLLQIMEAPPSFLCFICCTTDPQKLLPAVKSRCMQIKFLPASLDDITNNLKRVCDLEKIKYDQDGLEIIARSSRRSFRESLMILSHIQKLGVTGENASIYSGILSQDQIDQILILSLSRDYVRLNEKMKEVQESNANPSEVIRAMLERMIEITTARSIKAKPKTKSGAELYDICANFSALKICDALNNTLSSITPATAEELMLQFIMFKIGKLAK